MDTKCLSEVKLKFILLFRESVVLAGKTTVV